MVFRRAGCRESLICNIAAAYGWNYDPELHHLPNPWTPVLELYGMGYTTSGEDDVEGNGLTLLVGYRDGLSGYRII